MCDSREKVAYFEPCIFMCFPSASRLDYGERFMLENNVLSVKKSIWQSSC